MTRVGLSAVTVGPAAMVAGAIMVAGLLVRLLGRGPARALPGHPSPAGGSQRSWPSATPWTARVRSGWWEQRQARAARRRAWPAIADDLASALRAGASVRQALETVAAHGGAAAPRLAELRHPLSRGDDLAGAARRWADRSDDPDERLLAEAVELAAGATRAEPRLFDAVARAVRERAALAGEVRAQTAQARASATALCALPLMFTSLCALADRSVLAFLTGTVLGAACLIAGAGLLALGRWWMHQTIAGVAP